MFFPKSAISFCCLDRLDREGVALPPEGDAEGLHQQHRGDDVSEGIGNLATVG